MTKDLFAEHYVDTRAADRARRLATRLATSGLATFDHIDAPETLGSLAGEICTITPHRDSDPDGLTVIADTTGGAAPPPGFRAFSSIDLFPHTDGTALDDPPTLLWLACATPATEGGVSVLVDGAVVHAALVAKHPAELQALTTPVWFSSARSHRAWELARSGAVVRQHGPHSLWGQHLPVRGPPRC